MAGLGRKVFTAGDVLTASDVQNYLMDQTVMNFAGTAARSSAIATPTQGMVSYRDDIDNLELYNGTAWVSASGLQLVKKQTIGSGVSSVTVTGAFSATWSNYMIMVADGVGSTTAYMTLQLGSATTAYYSALSATLYSGATGFTASTNNGANFGQAGWNSVDFISLGVDLLNPFLTKKTLIKGAFAGTSVAGSMGGVHDSATSFTAFTLAPSSGTLTGGTIYVYGYGQ